MIDVWLKIRKRDTSEFVLKHLNYWLAMFSDRSKYKVYLYNEDFTDLPEWLDLSSITVNKQDLENDPECKKMIEAVYKNKTINNFWKKTAISLCYPYFYLKNSDIVINIDSDDMMYFSQCKGKLDQIPGILDIENLTTLSFDWLFSYNADDPCIPHCWTYGVNFSKTKKMKEFLTEALGKFYKHPFECGNIDYLTHMHLNTKNFKYLCFTFDTMLYDALWKSGYNPITNKVEAELHNKKKVGNVNPHFQTIIIK